MSTQCTPGYRNHVLSWPRNTVAAGLLILAVSPLTAATQEAGAIATYRNPRFGFTLSYPADRFNPTGERDNPNGRMWISSDGNARILAGALDNEDQTSLEDYRKLVLERSYSGATLDYAPIRDNWFVVSGSRDGTMFYERVSFTCGGRIINSWAMIYPTAERKRYDRIVEQIARVYKAGQGERGDCR